MTVNHIPGITYPAILLAVFANQLCLPIPAVLFLITAGALVASGNLSLGGVILAGVVGSLLADYAWFITGRWQGYRVVRALCSFSMDGQHCSIRARKFFSRWGLPSLMFAKFVPGLDGLMPPLAGALNVTTVVFLLFDAVGALFWSSGYCFVGYLFADRLDKVAASLNRASGILAIILGVVLCYFLWRAWELLRMMRGLRLRTISPAALQQILLAGKNVAVLDLLDVEGREDAATIPGIPGAARISPGPLRNSAKIRIPPDLQIVLYCSSPNQMTSARTAVALRRKGISNVWVLEGGLKRWRELNLPVTTKLSSPAQLAARFGVQLPEMTRKLSNSSFLQNSAINRVHGVLCNPRERRPLLNN
jgi:membrane protein DedA with SNARE-associated domain/rhodanese-related sulfurtransferase